MMAGRWGWGCPVERGRANPSELAPCMTTHGKRRSPCRNFTEGTCKRQRKAPPQYHSQEHHIETTADESPHSAGTVAVAPVAGGPPRHPIQSARLRCPTDKRSLHIHCSGSRLVQREDQENLARLVLLDRLGLQPCRSSRTNSGTRHWARSARKSIE